MSEQSPGAEVQLVSIGHSNHPIERFLELLKGQRIDVLVDVRSRPYSNYSPHFDREPLQQAVKDVGITYLFLGDELGGRPAGAKFYDDEGYVLYPAVAEAPFFRRGVNQLLTAAIRHRVAMMCSEEDPKDCHRYLLVGRVLRQRGVTVRHVRGDGRVQTDAEVEPQGSLFDQPEDVAWRSSRSVLPRNRPPNSSEG
jgi:uncharacterized protein (DUF488 family)